ncbi:MAG: tetratricopeptide repeat protein [Gemmatimonadetes bacterium]|nr:tetratricopeptide repeat protein [Gemmatimonadota bacterium]
MRSGGAVWLVALIAACGGAAAEHETLGDRAYGSRQFGDALIEYRLALKQHATARLRAKAGAAALRVGDLRAAAEEYLALAKASSARRSEAADGLERVARAAMQANDRPGLTAALTGLRQIAAGRALGSFAGALARGITESGTAAEAIAVLPYAAAAAPDARAEDSLILQYGRALVRSGRCQDGSVVFGGLIRRQRDAGVVRSAQQGLVQCALDEGREALQRGRPQEAEEWFRRAVVDGGEMPLARAAFLGLGDVMFARGDYLGAADAYQRAIQGAPPGDSLAEMARLKLVNLSNAGTVTP